MASITKTINRGVELLQSGKPDKAAALYREVLVKNPKHPDALNLLAVAVYQLGDAGQAVEYGRRAVELRPVVADYHSNLGRFYLTLGETEKAMGALNRALELEKNHAMARLNLATALAGQGRRAEAIALLEQCQRESWSDITGLHTLGNLASELGFHEQARACFARVLEINASLAEAENNLANALQNLGRLTEALPHYDRALQLRPDYPEAWSNKGAVLNALGNPGLALECLEQALRIAPEMVAARGNIGNMHMGQGRLTEAVAVFASILKTAPKSAETWNNLGNCYQQMGEYARALEAYQTALRISPGYFLVHNNIGNNYRLQGLHPEAIAAYLRGLAVDAKFAEAMNNLGVTYQDMGLATQARECFEQALAMRAGYPDPLINLGNYWRDRALPAKGEEFLRRAIAIDAGNGHSWNNLGCALSDQGRVEEALSAYRRGIELMPMNAFAHANLLLTLHYPGRLTPEELFAEHRAFAARHESRLAHLKRTHTNDPAPDRVLRVGYVSADFRRHSVAFFLEPVIERHTRGHFEIYGYADVMRPDSVTDRFRQLLGENWRDIRGYSEERFAELVRADRIDILVDLGGHTANSRAMSFCARPAPVQVSWLGYPNTTGLAAMDHRLTDAWADPPGTTETLHTEELVRLPGGFLCFRPAEETPPVTALPSSLGAPFSFGSFNNMAKVSQMTVEMWTQVLRAVPESRLALKNKALSEPEARRRIQDRFAALGIAPQRIWMGGAIESLAGHLEAYSQVDVALDTYPYHGTTTTCEALWMGVPVVSRLGRAHLSRVGLSLLEAAGLGHLAVDSAEAYVRTAAALAQDRGRLAQLRGGLRKTLSRSRLMDEQRFVKELEDAYRAMWRRWCAAEVVRKGEFRK